MYFFIVYEATGQREQEIYSKNVKLILDIIGKIR